MHETPLTMTATGPSSYVPGRPAMVTLTTDPPITDHAEVWFAADAGWQMADWIVPITNGQGAVPLYPEADGTYQFRIGATSSDEIPLAEDGAIPVSFVFTGSGWGHGVGMSQYGAASMASHGFSETQILTHYYAGTHVEMLPVTGSEDSAGDATVRVQVFGSSSDSKTDTILRVSPAGGTTGGTWTLTFYTASSNPIMDGGKPRRLTGAVGQDIAVHASGTTISATVDGVKKSGSIAVLTWSGTTYQESASTETPIAQILHDDGSSASNGTYRHGKLVIGTADGRRLNIVNVLKLNSEYLYGIAEVPSSWQSEALQAQAIAARNYAVANRGYKSSCDCQLYDDTRSQNFTGWNKESQGETGQWGARWVAAVDATTSDGGKKGMMLTYGSGGVGHLVTAFYFSSSGGQTENSEDVWVSALSYTRATPDPWSLDPAVGNKNALWHITIDQKKAAAAFGLPDVVRIEIISRSGPGEHAGVTTMRAWSSTGRTSTLSGLERIRTKLGLKSAWVWSIRPEHVEG